MSEDLQKLVDTAEASIRAAAVVAEQDASRPLYHFRAPSQWMDDPNGIIFHDGMYHMMYSLNPHSAEHRAGMVYKTAVRVWDVNSEDWTGGITVWGHARSKDLVHWEHLPIAVYPSIDKGEHFVWFGCTVINDEGVPMAVYTAIGPDMRPEDTAEQWAALGSPDLMTWRPLPSNPLLTGAVHGDRVIGEWRDPFLFKDAGRTFMVLGGRCDGKPVVALYEATNPGFTAWTYRGIIFTHPRGGVPSAECPNLFKLGNKWVLLVSPHAEVEYYVGELDPDRCTFTIENSGIVDYSRNFYATNVLFDDRGRALAWGALVGFKETKGWNCCVSLPREFSLSADGKLLQSPAAELRALRGPRLDIHHSTAKGLVVIGRLAQGQCLEFEAEFDHTATASFGLSIIHQDGRLDIELSPDSFRLGGFTAPLARREKKTKLQLFIDRTVLEIFIDNAACAARVIPLVRGAVEIGLYSNGGEAASAHGSVWQLQAEDLFTRFQG
ncbi:glycoside hydrolase family 32 protein [Sodalis sp. RH15]|uniref:glycoside hydrolase family 32 protein n=1 Tax=Sodalis sp. RH15 TaxID=3394330 RepID=UPI0039B5343C